MRCTTLIFTCFCITLVAGCASTPTPSRSAAISSRPLEKKVIQQQKQLTALDAMVQQLSTALTTTQDALTALRQEVAQLKQQPATTRQEQQCTPLSTDTPNTVNSEPSATDTYLQAFSAYTAADYTTATQGFNTFIQRYPRNPYIPNAHFWNGEALLAQDHLEQAIVAFSTVVKDYPEAHKAADALGKLAQIYAQLGQTSQAQQLLSQLQKTYPNSAASKRITAESLNTLAQ